jgi:cytochrome subunit of sulfide dehydrogenase
MDSRSVTKMSGNDVRLGIRVPVKSVDGAMNLRLLRCLTAMALFSAVTVFALAADVSQYPNLGRDIAANCANCHGTDGRSRGAIPSLAGQDAATIVQRMKEFRDGRRTATVMQQLAKGYTDAQIEAAAAYLAAQPKQ